MNKNKCVNRVINFITILFFTICVSSCDKIVDHPEDDIENIDCDNLKIGIINMNSEIVRTEINKLVTDLKPKRTSEDNIGQRENLDSLISRLNEKCNNISSEFICYACIETNPPQSEILVTSDSNNVLIQRVIDVMTPSDSNLCYGGIHEYIR